MPDPLMLTSVRNAQRADLPRLLPLIREIEAFHRNARPDIFQKPTDEDLLQHLDKFMTPPSYETLTATRGEELVGYVHLEIKHYEGSAMKHPRKWGVIDAIVVKGSERRNGIGTQLLRSSERMFRERGIHEVMLNVWEFNRDASIFYQKLGYQTETQLMAKRLGGS